MAPPRHTSEQAKAAHERRLLLQRERRKAKPRIVSDAEKRQKREHYDRNKEEILAGNKIRYVEKREDILQRCKNYTERNREQISLKGKQFRAANAERLSAKSKLNYINNKDLISKRAKAKYEKDPHIYIRNNTLRRMRSENTTSAKELMEADAWVLETKTRMFNVCAYCDKKLVRKQLEIDHIQPVSRGGQHKASNLCVSCRSCNSSKYNKLLYIEWFPKNYRRKFLLTLSEVQAFLGISRSHFPND